MDSMLLRLGTSALQPLVPPPRSIPGRSSTLVSARINWGRNRNISIPPIAQEFTIPLVPEANSTVTGGSYAMTVSVVSSIGLIPAEDWDACALDSAGADSANPFISHAFLSCLEDSGSASPVEGWYPQHFVAKNENGKIISVVPLYLKSHSYGEYVFDHSWASASYQYGVSYYPKLQSCIPFTPVTGPRILVRQGVEKICTFKGLCTALQHFADKLQVSSLHLTFPTKEDSDNLSQAGFLQRLGMQYHWYNQDYESFEEFLSALKQSKRKNIRKERKNVIEQNLQLKRLRGEDIKDYHWDAFFKFYRNTTDNKWGQAYLTRDFFHLLGSRMGDRVLLVVAEKDEKIVAGALNLIGGDAIYGRNWGCVSDAFYPNLHFEACYYQAIEAAIEWRLKKVEAGAQGEHKIQRGYIPTTTYSSHYIRNKDIQGAITDFLRHETAQIRYTIQVLKDASPYKDTSVHAAVYGRKMNEASS